MGTIGAPKGRESLLDRALCRRRDQAPDLFGVHLELVPEPTEGIRTRPFGERAENIVGLEIELPE